MLAKWMNTVNMSSAVLGISYVDGLWTRRDARVLDDSMYQNWTPEQPNVDIDTDAVETILNNDGTWAVQKKGVARNVICEYIGKKRKLPLMTSGVELSLYRVYIELFI